MYLKHQSSPFLLPLYCTWNHGPLWFHFVLLISYYFSCKFWFSQINSPDTWLKTLITHQTMSPSPRLLISIWAFEQYLLPYTILLDFFQSLKYSPPLFKCFLFSPPRAHSISVLPLCIWTHLQIQIQMFSIRKECSGAFYCINSLCSMNHNTWIYYKFTETLIMAYLTAFPTRLEVTQGRK